MRRPTLLLVAAIFALFFALLPATPAYAAWKICVDPGHGGSDPGAGGYGLSEADLNLDAALRLRDLFNADTAATAGGNSWTVLMTRTTNVFISLSSRVSYANSNGAHRFVSIHTNAGGGVGTETFMYYEGSATSLDQRNKIQEEMLEHAQRYNRGLKTAGFYVIKYTAMPATLTEMAFVDNAGDAAKLGLPAWRQQVARAHLHALQRSYGGTPYDPGAPPPPTGGPTWTASLVSVTAPSTLASGATGTVTVKLKNTGTATWTPAAVKLGTAAPYDHPSTFVNTATWASATRPAAVAATVAPGATGSFSFTIRAPAVGATVAKTETLQARRNETAWFGPQVSFTVTVTPPASRPAYGALSAGLTYGHELYLDQTTTVTIKMQNTGTQTWTPAKVKLGTWGPANRSSALRPPTGWLSATRPVAVAANTPPGAIGTFTFQLRSPSALEAATVYLEDFRLINAAGLWFGPAVTLEIVVSPFSLGGPPVGGGHGG